MKHYSENEIGDIVAAYAERHGLDVNDVDVCRAFEGGTENVVGVRLSPGDGTRCDGIDEKFGEW